MLLRSNCIRDRDCANCDFEPECIVQRTMYSKFSNKPDFITEGDSVGYVLECEDLRTSFEAGESLSFYIILFGKTIVYFSQYLSAIYALGSYGMGKDNCTFSIESVQNTHGRNILSGNDIFMKYYKVENVNEYVEYRLQKLREECVGKGEYQIIFRSPLSLKYHGEMLEIFNEDAILRSAIRRIYIFDCFEENGAEKPDIKELQMPRLLSQDHRTVLIPRYSNRKQQKISLSGLIGEAVLGDVSEDVLKILLAGEILHIGKNTSFGFGRYVVLPPE